MSWVRINPYSRTRHWRQGLNPYLACGLPLRNYIEPAGQKPTRSETTPCILCAQILKAGHQK